MLARELARPLPTVGLDTDALEAARILAEQRLPGLIVVDDNGLPHSVLPGSQVLRFVVPAYVQDDPALARAYDEKSADALCEKLVGRTVGDLLSAKDRVEIPLADPEATAIGLCAQMAGMRSPIIAVVENDTLLGAITVSVLLAHLLGEAAR